VIVQNERREFIANMRASHAVKPLFSKVFAVFILGAAGLPLSALAAPRIPSDPAEVLERLPIRPGDATARELAGLRAAVIRAAKEAPTDPEPATELAERYYDLAVARGDPRYIGYADAVMAPFAASQTPAALAMRGQLKQYRHDFEGALADFAAALRADPQFASAHAWRGAIYLVQANYPAAKAECDALQTLGRATLFGACIGLTRAYNGQMEAGFAALQRALEITKDPGNRLWLLTRMGEVAAWRGQAAAAEKNYRAALALGIDDGYLLAAWTDFLLDQNRHAEVAKLLTGWETSDGLLLRLALAETTLKLPTAKAHVQALKDRFDAAKARGDTTHRAEEARFQLQLAGNAAVAVAIAAANYQVQREPRDARALLEAAIAAKDSAAAQPVRDWLQSSGFEDAHLRQLGAASSQSASGIANAKPETRP
jgi:tetratricopeptide (TPR) repeat protein